MTIYINSLVWARLDLPAKSIIQWPGKCTEITEDGRFMITLFSPPNDHKSIIACNSNEIEAFRNKKFKLFKLAGFKHSLKQYFEKAFNECVLQEDELDTDDEYLPSFQSISAKKACREPEVESLSLYSPTDNSASAKSSSRKSKNPEQKNKFDIGSYVLAYCRCDRAYHPATVITLKEDKNSYRVQYWNNYKATLTRNRLFAPSDSEFAQVNISQSIIEYQNSKFSYFDSEEELLAHLETHQIQIFAIYENGLSGSCRSKIFMRGGKERYNLSANVYRGPFSVAETSVILEWLIKNLEDRRDDSMPLTEHTTFITSVVYPDTLNLIIQIEENCDYKDAENTMRNRSNDWIDHLVAEYEIRRKVNSMNKKKDFTV